LEIGWAAAEPGASEARLELTDDTLQPGSWAYYLRVRQWDGGLAWTSPVFVDYTPSA
jgi:hypothetical protein